jgi:hypothetical protein
VAKRVTTTIRMPEELLDEIRQMAHEEERPLNTQLLRLIRAGLEHYRGDDSKPIQPEQRP